MNAIDLCEQSLLPDWLVRIGMRKLMSQRLRAETRRSPAGRREIIDTLRTGPIACHADKANTQHYELPEEFFRAVLGKHLKYSCCYWNETIKTLDKAESAMLAMTCARADLHDGMRILELGCGWGAVTLWMAEYYPSSRIVAVSNSARQKQAIENRARMRELENVEIVTADINDFHTSLQFDRVVSVEMFEHVRNYQELMRRIGSWLTPSGRLFVHIFCHRTFTYPFENSSEYDWMSRNFFTGGMMPSKTMLLEFQDDLSLENQWQFSGKHYEKTANAWLSRLDRNHETVVSVFEDVYGKQNAALWVQRWRMFFMACAELFGYGNGDQWIVGQYLFRKNPEAQVGLGGIQ